MHALDGCAYSLQATPWPLVSTPLTWDEVEEQRPDLFFGLGEVLERVERLGDLFAPVLDLERALPG